MVGAATLEGLKACEGAESALWRGLTSGEMGFEDAMSS